MQVIKMAINYNINDDNISATFPSEKKLLQHMLHSATQPVTVSQENISSGNARAPSPTSPPPPRTSKLVRLLAVTKDQAVSGAPAGTTSSDDLKMVIESQLARTEQLPVHSNVATSKLTKTNEASDSLRNTNLAA